MKNRTEHAAIKRLLYDTMLGGHPRVDVEDSYILKWVLQTLRTGEELEAALFKLGRT